MLQQGWGALEHWFRRMFASSLTLGYVPKVWQGARGVSLPKPGKESYQRAKSFRLITLTSFQLKTLERIILWYLEAKENINTKLHPRQFGFRKGRSTEAALHQLVTRLEKSIIAGDFTIGCFLDIEGAFDNVKFESIENSLRYLGISSGLIRWISHMLRNRWITVSLGDSEQKGRVTRGCPQGGILSPLMWNVVIDGLLHLLDKEPGYSQAYADDLTMIMRGIDISTLYSLTQQNLNKVTEWAGNHGLKFSHLKTEIVIFTHRRKWVLPDTLKLYGQELQIKRATKYLGVMLDSRLTWNLHLENRIQRTTCTLMQCRRVIGKTWGLNPSRAKWMYTSIIRPMISYASVVWVNVLGH
jgi:retron-type reverse transcriptase